MASKPVDVCTTTGCLPSSFALLIVRFFCCMFLFPHFLDQSINQSVNPSSQDEPHYHARQYMLAITRSIRLLMLLTADDAPLETKVLVMTDGTVLFQSKK
jgi:hypothetical protein